MPKLLVAGFCSIALACASRAPTAAAPPPVPPPATKADDCRASCDGVVRSRHDACGRDAGPPWPDWCADSNEAMREQCLATCRD